MTKEKNVKYKKAYVELNTILKVIPKEQLNKIPNNFIKNISKNEDKNYIFEYDMSKELFEQNIMAETKALLVEIYERFLAPKEEQELWKKYDEFCLKRIDEEKRKKYSVEVFNDHRKIIDEDNINEDNNTMLIKYEKQNLIKKIIHFVKNTFRLRK